MNFKEFLVLFKDGTSGAILIAIGIFIWRAGWPWLKQQIAIQRSDRKEELASFLKSLERQEAGFDKVMERRDAEFGKVVKELSRLGDKIDIAGARRKRR